MEFVPRINGVLPLELVSRVLFESQRYFGKRACAAEIPNCHFRGISVTTGLVRVRTWVDR